MEYFFNRVRQLRLALLTACVAFGASSSLALGCTTNSAGPFVRQFYGLNGHPSSVPPADELRAQGAPFSQRLRKSLLEAAMVRDDFVSAYPDHLSDDGDLIAYKPPFVDGDIFTGSPDGATRFEISNVHATSSGQWLVRVRSIDEAGTSTWQVMVRVVKESNQCVVDDVIYGWKPGAETLTESLRRDVRKVRLAMAAERKQSKVLATSCARAADCKRAP